MRGMGRSLWILLAMAFFVGCGDDDPSDNNGDGGDILDPCKDLPPGASLPEACDPCENLPAGAPVPAACEAPDPFPDVPEVTTIPEACNGHAELCERRYDEVAYPATHNAMSAAAEGWYIPNQHWGIERQLEDGIRVMLLDIYTDRGRLKLCHTVCLIGERDLKDALHALRSFLRSERGEVLTLILQDETSTEAIVEAFRERGLDEYAYVYDPEEGWPTLGELIASNKRLIVTAERGRPTEDAPWYHHAWDVMFDNKYSHTTVDDFDCAVNRGRSSHALYLLNHWLQDPASKPELAAIANTFEVLHGHASDCMEARDQLPNFIAVDHYDQGDLFEVVRALNGLN